MIAYKFLAAGRVGPFTGFRWPPPGAAAAWVEAPEAAPDDVWIHACRVADLPYWLGEELWRVELAGPVRAVVHQVASPRGRLTSRVTGWDRGAGRDFAADCASRARDLASPLLGPTARDALLAARDVRALREASERLGEAGGGAAELVKWAAAAVIAERPALGGFVLEMLATKAGGLAAGEAERARQARWLAQRLALDDA